MWTKKRKSHLLRITGKLLLQTRWQVRWRLGFHLDLLTTQLGADSAWKVWRLFPRGEKSDPSWICHFQWTNLWTITLKKNEWKKFPCVRARWFSHSVTNTGRNPRLFKPDWCDAFKKIPCKMSDLKLRGFKWQTKYFVKGTVAWDFSLPFFSSKLHTLDPDLYPNFLFEFGFKFAEFF